MFLGIPLAPIVAGSTSPGVREQFGTIGTILIIAAFLAACMFWGWLKENGYKYHFIAGVCGIGALVALMGQSAGAFFFWFAISAWAIWKADDDKNN